MLHYLSNQPCPLRRPLPKIDVFDERPGIRNDNGHPEGWPVVPSFAPSVPNPLHPCYLALSFPATIPRVTYTILNETTHCVRVKFLSPLPFPPSLRPSRLSPLSSPQ